MKYLWILITDKTNIFALDTGSLSLPNHSHWPSNKPFKRNNMHDALYDHILCGLKKPFLKKHKMKRVFGMPVKSSCVVYEIDNVDLLVKDIKKLKLWWTVHCGASLEWKIRSISVDDSKLLDVTSAAIMNNFFSQRV